MEKSKFVDVVSARPLDGSYALIHFDDGAARIVDLEPLMVGPVFDELRDGGQVANFEVDQELGTIVWPNGADLPPHRLRQAPPVRSPEGLLSAGTQGRYGRSRKRAQSGLAPDYLLRTLRTKQTAKIISPIAVGTRSIEITYSSRRRERINEADIATALAPGSLSAKERRSTRSVPLGA